MKYFINKIINNTIVDASKKMFKGRNREESVMDIIQVRTFYKECA